MTAPREQGPGPGSVPGPEEDQAPAAWHAWRDVAAAPWSHRLALPGGRLRAQLQGLEQDAGEAWVWVEEEVWEGPAGALLYARRARRAQGPEEVTLVPAGDAEALVRALEATVGRTPGLVELLGRAGIEVGLAPDDQVEGDEIDDWPERPPPGQSG